MPSTATTPSPAYPSPLPDAGIAATEWALDLAYGSRKQDAWVTTVIDIHARSEWAGDSYRLRHDELEYRSDAGHYVAIGVFKPGADRRTDENVEAVAVLVFDDVGSLGDPGIKMDKDWLRDRLEPTFIVETSTGNFQHSYVFDEPVGPDDYHALIEALKLVPEAVGGIKDGTSLTRYVRLPSGKNPKAEKGGFKTRLVAGSGKKYSLSELQAAFGLQPKTTGAAGAGKAKSAPIPEALALPETEALALLDEIEPLIRNNGIGREDWIGIVYGFFNASGQNDDVEDIIDRFTAKREDGPTDPVDDFEHVWETRHTATKAGLTTLIRWLEKQGTPEATAMVDRVHQIQAKSVFPPVDNSGDNPPGPGAEPVIEDEAIDDAMGTLNAAGFQHDKQEIIWPGFVRGEATLVAGPTGTMKSLLMAQLSVALVSGRPGPLGAAMIDYCGSVVFYSNEDAPKQLMKRLDAIQRRHGLKGQKPVGQLSIRTQHLLTRKTTRDGEVIDFDAEELTALRKIAGKREVALIVIDTLAAAIASKETNEEFQRTMNLLKPLAAGLNAAIAVTHHFRKGQPGAKDEAEETPVDNVRGGGALTAAAKLVLLVEKPNKVDVAKYGMKDDAHLHMKLSDRKNSYQERGPVRWFKLETVALTVRDKRDGSLGVENAPTLVPCHPDANAARLDILKKALAALDAAQTLQGRLGKNLRWLKKITGEANSVTTILGMTVEDASSVIDELTARKAVVTARNKNLKTDDLIVIDAHVFDIPEAVEEGYALL